MRVHERRVGPDRRGTPACGGDDEDERVRPGDLNEDLGDHYTTILYQDGGAVVYINEHGMVRMSYGGDTVFPREIGSFEAEAVALQYQPVEGMTDEERRWFMTLIGRAWVVVLEGAAPDADRIAWARKLLGQAAAYRAARLGEVSRELYLTYGAWHLFWIWMIGLVLWMVHEGVAEMCGPGAPRLINAVVMGATGAMVSVCLRLDTATLDPAAGRVRHRIEIGGRLFVGGMTALAACMLFSLGLVTIGGTGASPTYAALVVALFAGASERLFPSLGPKFPPPKPPA